MRIFVVVFILFMNIILQSTYFEHMQILGVKPNTAIIIIVAFSLMRGSIEGAVIGFFAGLLQDILFGSNIGFNALLGMYVGYFCGKLNKDFYSENYFLELGLCILSVLCYEFIVYIFNFLLLGKVNFWYYFNTIIFPEMVYTSFVSIFVYKLLYIVNGKLEEFEKSRRF